MRAPRSQRQLVRLAPGTGNLIFTPVLSEGQIGLNTTYMHTTYSYFVDIFPEASIYIWQYCIHIDSLLLIS